MSLLLVHKRGVTPDINVTGRIAGIKTIALLTNPVSTGSDEIWFVLLILVLIFLLGVFGYALIVTRKLRKDSTAFGMVTDVLFRVATNMREAVDKTISDPKFSEVVAKSLISNLEKEAFKKTLDGT